MVLETTLQSIRADLTGRFASDNELLDLQRAVPDTLVPLWFAEVLKAYPLIDSTFVLDQDNDVSGIGVDMRWLSPAQIVDECCEAFPGIAAVKLDYLPVGSCLEGSGDPYFVRMSGSQDPPLVRIPHEAVNAKEELDESRVELVSQSLSEFFKNSKVT